MKFQMLIEVKDANVRTMSGVAKRTGRAYSMREQSGWADLGKPYPVEVRFLLSDNQEPMPPGKYMLDESSVFVDRNGAVAVDLRKLKPVVAAQAAPNAQTGRQA